MIIIGAGLTGLIAATMLRHHQPLIIEEALELPRKPRMRFRSSVISSAVAVPFDPITVTTGIYSTERNPVILANRYSEKASGEIRSPGLVEGQVKQWVGPDDIITRLASGPTCTIQLGTTWAGPDPAWEDEAIISTIPMGDLMDLLHYDNKPEFEFRDGWTIDIGLRSTVDVYQTMLFPDDADHYHRVDINRNEMRIHFSTIPTLHVDDYADDVCDAMAIDRSHIKEVGGVNRSKYGAIREIDRRTRLEFISWASREHGVYSLGKYATWRPEFDFDDLVKDVQAIETMITESEYV
jgi:hypothetical protein